MTYQEALNLKSTLPKEVKYNNILMQIHIVPDGQSDFNNFMKFFYGKSSLVDDTTALIYCTNGEYSIHGLSRMGTANLFLTLPNLINICNNK